MANWNLSSCQKSAVFDQLLAKRAIYILFAMLFVNGIEDSNASYKTMTAQDVANAINDEQLCSPTISDDTCISSQLMDPSDWDDGGIHKLKDGIISKFNQSICVTPCTHTLPNNQTVEKCGPFYFYLTTFSVLPGGVKKAEFAAKFSRELLSALNAAEQKKNGGKECEGVFLFFFSRVDRLIALEAPYSSYFFDYQSDVYQGVKGFYTKAMDKDGYDFDEAVYETFEVIDKCLKKQDGFCMKSHSKKKSKPYTILMFIGGAALVMGLVIASVVCGKKGSHSVSRPSKPAKSGRSSISSVSSASSSSASNHDEGDHGGDC